MNGEQQNPTQETQLKVPIIGYAALVFAIIFFSGFSSIAEFQQWIKFLGFNMQWITALDFNVVNGSFGTMKDHAATFTGRGGAGAREGFLFALTLAPTVMFALGVVELVDHLGGLKAAQKLLTPILRPIIGIPGICGLALISSLQSADAGASMTKSLRQNDHVNENEKTIFAAFQFSGGGLITNYLSSGAALFAFLTVPIILPLIVIFVMKIFGANIVRFYLKKFDKGEAVSD